VDGCLSPSSPSPMQGFGGFTIAAGRALGPVIAAGVSAMIGALIIYLYECNLNGAGAGELSGESGAQA